MDPPQESADALWAQVLEGWADDKRHKAFLSYCVEMGLLEEAARRYRQVADEAQSTEGYRAQSERADDARQRLGAVAMLAVATLEQQRTAPDISRAMTLFKLFAGLFLLGGLIALGWALSLR
ncbi:MAG: hypothetical protein IPM79_23610 [Polyangiaceae bacterium]|jgi:hypothetical protein|nr:hypothetical protein [Polyangiaceae bacterium]MBK8940516.1 hypothetical protein [Polyangiaceae bacterium]